MRQEERGLSACPPGRVLVGLRPAKLIFHLTEERMTILQIARIGIPFVASGVFYSISLEGSFRTFQDTWFFRLGPGASPPWYFIGNNLVDALWSFPCALALIAFSFLTARQLPPPLCGPPGVSPLRL